MTTLCNQPEAFASDLGDDQWRYLYFNQNCYLITTNMSIFVITITTRAGNSGKTQVN